MFNLILSLNINSKKKIEESRLKDYGIVNEHMNSLPENCQG